jgi:hypothetical protein
MRSAPRVVSALAVLAGIGLSSLNIAVAAAQGLVATPRDNPAQAVGTATIRGRVVAADTGAPIRGASITVSSEQAGSLNVLTDDTGRYQVTGVPSGSHSVTASKPGYISLSYGQTRPSQGGKPVVLAGKQTLDNVNLALPKGGVIAGLVLDQYGEPVVGAAVAAMRVTYKDGRRVLAPVSNGIIAITGLVLTNDLGEFRVYGLEPGAFYVGAQTLTRVSNGPARPGVRPDAIVYAPGTWNPREAQRLIVGVSQTVGGIMITVGPPSKLATVSGTAVDLENVPLQGARVTLLQRASEVALDLPLPGATTEPDGTFTLNEILPGDYDVYAVKQGLADPPLRVSLGRVSVTAEDHRCSPLPSIATGTDEWCSTLLETCLRSRPRWNS